MKWESKKFIGISLEELNPELSEFFGVKDGLGLLIKKVHEDTPAHKAGLKVGDVITEAEGEKLDSFAEFLKIIQEKEGGDKITLKIIRNKKAKSVEVEIKEEENEFIPQMFSGKPGKEVLGYFRSGDTKLNDVFRWFSNKDLENLEKGTLKNNMLLYDYLKKQKEKQKDAKKNIVLKYRSISI